MKTSADSDTKFFLTLPKIFEGSKIGRGPKIVQNYTRSHLWTTPYKTIICYPCQTSGPFACSLLPTMIFQYLYFTQKQPLILDLIFRILHLLHQFFSMKFFLKPSNVRPRNTSIKFCLILPVNSQNTYSIFTE